MADAARNSSIRGKNPVYRASCDYCKAAKVRCCRTKPSCTRCLRHEVPCVYGISQRAGKHSAETYNTVTGNADRALPARSPTMLSTSTGTATPRTSTTVDLRPTLLSPVLSTQGSASPDSLLGQQHKHWAFDSIFEASEALTSTETSLSYEHENHALSGEDDTSLSHTQHQTLDTYNAIFADLFDAPGLVASGQDDRPEHLFDDKPTNSDVDRATSCQRHDSPSSGTCQCSENIIIQLSSLPVFLHHKRCPLDVELVQFQEAVRLCKGALACTCASKDYNSVLTISMLIGRIISILERGGATEASNNDSMLARIAGNTHMGRSPKFSLGIYQMGIEEESKLKQEVWWLQCGKVESIVAGFKEMVIKLNEQEMYQDMVQAATWEKVSSLLDQKAQSVKREWMASRDRR